MTDDTIPEPVLQFPCDMYIKSMGIANSKLKSIVFKIAQKHFPQLEEKNLSVKASKGGKYESVTIEVRVNNRQELDSVYAELKCCEQIVMVL